MAVASVQSEQVSKTLTCVCAALVLTTLACSGDGAPATPTAFLGGAGNELPVAQPATLYAAEAGDRAAAVSAGDFNADGAVDIALAAGFADGPENGRPDAGEVYVFAGPFRAGEVRDAAAGDQILTIFGARAGDQAGRALATADVDGDGTDDLVLGSPSADGPSGDRVDAGRVDVVFGSAGLGADFAAFDLADGGGFTFHGASASDFAGFALQAANLNGDLSSDLVIGAFYAAGPGDSRPLAGEVYVVHGGALRGSVLDLAVTSPDIIVYGAAAEDRLGEGLGAGDINGDGTDDLVVPAPFAVNLAGERDSGQTYVLQTPLPPTVDLATYTPFATVYGADDGDQLGHVTTAGDVDGDGRQDILLTAVSSDGPENGLDLAGGAAVILNPSLSGSVDAAGDADIVIHGPRREARLGRSAALGDINGDGVAELLLGAPGALGSDGTARGGSLYVVSAPGLPAESSVTEVAQVYAGEQPEAALATEIYGRMPIEVVDLDAAAGGEIIVTASGGDGPGQGRADCGYALILFISQ